MPPQKKFSLKLGHEYLEMKNIAGAIEAYRNAIEIDPKGSMVENNSSISFLKYIKCSKISEPGMDWVKPMSFKA
jgi:hypothetical protein